MIVPGIPAERTAASRLRFPSAPSRPGDEVRFDLESMGAAGQVPRPAVDAEAEVIHGIRHGLVRVLDDEGNAAGPWASDSVGRQDLELGLRDMAIVRAFDAAMLRAHRQGKTSFYMQCLGEEAVACAHRRALAPGDMSFPTYRQQGLLVAAGYRPGSRTPAPCLLLRKGERLFQHLRKPGNPVRAGRRLGDGGGDL